MMNGHTPRTVKSRIEINADEKNVAKKANIDDEQNETKRKNKIFMTDYQSGSELKDVFSFHDLIIPNSKTAKIVFFIFKICLYFIIFKKFLVYNQRRSK